MHKNISGGVVSFTAHLAKALRTVGCEPEICRVTNTTQSKHREFGDREYYVNYSVEDTIADKRPTILTCGDEEVQPQLTRPYIMIVHDLNHVERVPDDLPREFIVVIRKQNLDLVDGCHFIPHPYAPRFDRDDTVPPLRGREFIAISRSRISKCKNTWMLIEANRFLRDQGKPQIKIYGREDRIYSFRFLSEKYVEWTVGGREFPRTPHAAVNLAARGIFDLDMTNYDGDGGGTQYTFLEAADAGCIPILLRSWCEVPNSRLTPGENCFVVDTSKDIADRVGNPQDAVEYTSNIRRNNRLLLREHDPKVIGKIYRDLLEKLP